MTNHGKKTTGTLRKDGKESEKKSLSFVRSGDAWLYARKTIQNARHESETPENETSTGV